VAAPSVGTGVRRLFGRAPAYDELYGLLERAGNNAEAATALLHELMGHWPEGADRRHDMRELEHEGDRLTHDIVHHLYTKTVAPVDQEDALALATELDDVVDYAEEAADFLALYNVEAPMEQAIALTAVLRAAGHEIAASLSALPRLSELRPHLVEIHRLENEGDRIVRDGLGALFSGGIDPLVIVRWKDIYERVEQAIDATEHVAHVLEGILVKQL
jgi:uncharacterized protein